jgi:hypothetical protein
MATEVVHDDAGSRYEIVIDGEHAGHIDYVRRGDSIDLVHTEIDPSHQGAGLASILARGTLDDLRDHSDARVIASCPYVSGWIAKHPDYETLTTR